MVGVDSATVRHAGKVDGALDVLCYGVDYSIVGTHPTSWERPTQEAQTRSGSKAKYGYIIQDNKQICTPVYPTQRVQDNQPK